VDFKFLGHKKKGVNQREKKTRGIPTEKMIETHTIKVCKISRTITINASRPDTVHAQGRLEELAGR